ncbi:MAG: hypothetical protein U0840_19260 [Gemmataceae bacterium]
MRRVLRGVRYRKSDPPTHHLAIRWKRGLPARRDEPWLLMTDRVENAVELTDCYGKRMTIAELFRDGKVMLEEMQVSADQAFAVVLAATFDILSKRGTTWNWWWLPEVLK